MENKSIYHLLNETGYILIRTSNDPGSVLPEPVVKELSKVVLFCNAMLSAIRKSVNPHTGKPYSIYNFHAIESIIEGSEQFVKMDDQKYRFHTNSIHHSYSHELFHKLYGVTLKHRETQIVSSIIDSLSKEALRMLDNKDLRDFKAGTLTFILEYINGISSISVQTVHIDCFENQRNLKRAACKIKPLWRHEWFINTQRYTHVAHYKSLNYS